MVASLGPLVRIERPGVGPANNHISEDGSAVAAYVDTIVKNEGSLEDLNNTVTKLVAAYRLMDEGI